MKKLLLLLCILPLFAFQSIDTEISIVGTWKGEDKGDIGFMSFDEEGYTMFETGDQKIGGKEFDMRGRTASLTYTLNRETNPFELDLIITFADTKETSKILGIVEFESQNKMHLALGFGISTRPTEFDDINSIYFFRQE